MTTTERPERSVPKPVFTDAEAGAREFPDSGAERPPVQLLHPGQAQADPLRGRHRRGPARPAALPVAGLDLRLRQRRDRLPAALDEAQGLGRRRARAAARDRHAAGCTVQNWPAHGWHEFRDPNEEWEQTLYRNNANVVRQLNQNVENARNSQGVRACGPRTGCTSSSGTSARGCTSSTSSGSTCSRSNERSCPTNMHNTALAANSTRKIRFAQDLALYNLTLSEEIEGFDGAAHVEAWNSDPEWQGARKLTEALTAIEDDWGEAMFATNVVFEPLIGELFRSNLVMQSAAPQRRLRHPDRDGRRRERLRPARPALDDRLLRPARAGQGVRRPQPAAHGRLAGEVGAAGAGGRAHDAAAVVGGRPQAAAFRGQPRQGEEPVRRDLHAISVSTPPRS